MAQLTIASQKKTPQGDRWQFNVKVSNVTNVGGYVSTAGCSYIDFVGGAAAEDIVNGLRVIPNVQATSDAANAHPGDCFLSVLSGTSDVYLTLLGR